MRKNILVLALLFCGGLSLAAQSRLDLSIYVTPVTGNGGKPEDNSLFYKQLVLALAGQNTYNLAKTQSDADYSLVGSLAHYSDAAAEGQFVFHLELWDSKTSDFKVEGELLYVTPDDISQQVPVLVTTLLYTIPEDESMSDDWRNKLLYLGAAVTWTPRIYDKRSGYPGDPYFSFSLEYHFLSFLSLETGIELAVDEVRVKLQDYVYRDTVIEIPLLLKFVINRGSYFMLEPYGGIYFNISPRKTTKPPPLAWLVGFQTGVKAGSGVAFFDVRFAMDTKKSKVGTGATEISYQRSLIYFGLGYKYGLFNR